MAPPPGGRKSISEPTLEWSKYASIMDVPEMERVEEPPFHPPTHLYLQEVIVALRGSSSDTTVQNDAKRGSPRAILLIERVQAMNSIITSSLDAAEEVCLAVLWMAFQVFFAPQPNAEVIKSLRGQLAQGWYLLSLETGKFFPHKSESEGRDWVTQALPFMFAQAVYRILCDAFDEDRKHVISQASHLIDKLNIMAHFEVTGFQLNAETGQKCRRQLFQRRVVKHPHTDQLAFVRGQKRQEMLESHKDTADPILTFGQSDGVPLEESQLGHVLQNRLEAVHKRPVDSHGQAEYAGTKIYPMANVWIVPAELSVDRYEDLAATGVSILSRQFHDLTACMRRPRTEERSDGSPSSAVHSEAGSPKWSVRIAGDALGHTHGRKVMSRGGAGADDGGIFSATARPLSNESMSRPETTSDGGVSRSASSRGHEAMSWSKRSLSRTSLRAIGVVAKLSKAARDKEKALKERKQKQESVYTRLKEVPLSDDLQSRELWTTWVSPAIQTLCGEDGAQFVSRKTAAQGMHLKMHRVERFHTPSTPTSKAKDSATSPRRRAVSPQRVHWSTGSRSLQGRVGVQDAAGTTGMSTATGQLPRVGSSPATVSIAAGSTRDATGASGHAQSGPLDRSTSSYQGTGKGEMSSTLDQSAPVNYNVIMHSTFAEYMKEYHIFTNTPKIRIDEKRLREEEDASLSKAKSLGLHRRAQKRNNLERILLANAPDPNKPSKPKPF